MALKSGVLIVCKNSARILLLREHRGRKYGDLWSMVAGSIEEGESAIEAARRETQEETGLDSSQVDYYFMDREEFDDHSFNFFVGVVDEEFTPRLSEEHTEHMWIEKDELPDSEELYPGMEDKIKDL